MTAQQFRDGCTLFGVFFKAMAFAFTSGQAALPTLEKEIVQKHHWLNEQDFWEIPAVSHTLPGVISLHNAVQFGSIIAGWFGSVMAVLATVFTAFFSMLLVTVVFYCLPGNQGVLHFVQGLRAVSIAVLMSGAVRLVRSCKQDWFSYVVILAAMLLPLVFDFSTFYTIILCGLVGILYQWLCPDSAADDVVGTQDDEE